jgi:hypothetical protein
LGRAGQKKPLGGAAGNIFLSGALQISLDDGLGDAIGDALTPAPLDSSPANNVEIKLQHLTQLSQNIQHGLLSIWT